MQKIPTTLKGETIVGDQPSNAIRKVGEICDLLIQRSQSPFHRKSIDESAQDPLTTEYERLLLRTPLNK